jgi:hypothetical protein
MARNYAIQTFLAMLLLAISAQQTEISQAMAVVGHRDLPLVDIS